MPAFQQITDDAFPGAKSIDFIGQMFVYVEPMGRYWGWSSLADGTSWNSLDQAQAETAPDRIQGLIVSHNEVLLFGERTIEPWAFAPEGNATFQLQVGSVIESGCGSGKTIKRLDNSVFYLNESGQVARLNGYTPQIISTAAMEAAIRDCDMSRAFAMTWEDSGHSVYYITFPDGHTWGYDVRQGLWHRRESFGLDRWRINALIKSNGTWYAGDYADGRVYELEWGNVYEGCEIMPRTLTTGVLHSAANRVTVHGFSITAATGQPPTMPGSLLEAEPEPTTILITGSGDTPFITAETAEVPTFAGIATSTGADVAQAACTVNSEGVFIAVGASEVVYSTSVNTAWTNVTPVHGTIGRFGSYGPDGWLLQHRAASHAGLLARASSTPTDLAALTINISGGATRTTLSMSTYTGGMYYGSVGFESTQMLLGCATIGGTWNVITTDATSIPGGGGDGIRFFHDIKEFGGALYASVFVATGPGFATAVGQQVRRSNDGGATWPDLIVNGTADTTIPLQLCKGGGVLLIVNSNVASVYTSADDFAEPHSTGTSRSAESLPRNEIEGRNVAYASRRFFIMGDTGVVSTMDGITFSAVASYPGTFNTPISIAAYSDPDEIPVVAPDCTPMEGGFFQLRYANDGAENWSNWRDFPAPQTGKFLQPLVARRLGMARHRVWEIMDTSNRPQDVLAASIIAE